MVFKNFKAKQITTKTISILLAIALLCSLMPMGSVFVSASAEQPVYDPSLGEYSAKNGILTATPYENAGFRGWFDKKGNEVSSELNFTLPSGASANDYTPVFYDFNLAINGGFEEYADGTNLKSGVPTEEIWEGTCDNEIDGSFDWTTATVTTKRAKSGQ